MLALPLASAVAAMFKTSVNIPLNDDYDGILSYLDHFAHTSGYFARLGWLLTAEHAKYKLILLNTVVTLQYVVLGHLNFRALELLGDLSVPAIIWTLWLLLARQRRPLSQAVWLILVPWYLFLSLCYWETLNWTTGEFQALAVIPLSIGCVLFFTSSIRHAEIWGTLFLILSIAANGSGFFLAAALVAVLIYTRRVRAGVLVILAGCIMAAIYCVHYAGISDPRPPPHLGALLAFPFAFLGSIVSTFPWCIAFGVILVATCGSAHTRVGARQSGNFLHRSVLHPDCCRYRSRSLSRRARVCDIESLSHVLTATFVCRVPGRVANLYSSAAQAALSLQRGDWIGCSVVN